MRVVSNAGPIIHLSWVGRLDVLGELFEEVMVPPAVREEVLVAGSDVPGIPAIRSAFAKNQLIISAVTDRGAVTALEGSLHRGEAEAIMLMQESKAHLLLVDDREARRQAQARGMPIAGTVGVLRMARERGLVPNAAPIIAELQRQGFRISPALAHAIQREEQ